MAEGNTYSLTKLPLWHPFYLFGRRLSRGGHSKSSAVAGDAIGLEVKFGGLTLVETNYDYFDACSHWIYLLSEDVTVLDELHLPDVFGFIQDIEKVSDCEVKFGFFGTNDRWSAQIEPGGYWSFAANALRYRLNRKLLSKRYIRLTRHRGPPWKTSP